MAVSTTLVREETGSVDEKNKSTKLRYLSCHGGDFVEFYLERWFQWLFWSSLRNLLDITICCTTTGSPFFSRLCDKQDSTTVVPFFLCKTDWPPHVCFLFTSPQAMSTFIVFHKKNYEAVILCIYSARAWSIFYVNSEFDFDMSSKKIFM